MNNYKIEREHHSQHTYNGYEDSPYWRITIEGNQVIGLKDDGKWWKVSKVYYDDGSVERWLESIIKQCGLDIQVKGAELWQN